MFRSAYETWWLLSCFVQHMKHGGCGHVSFSIWNIVAAVMLFRSAYETWFSGHVVQARGTESAYDFSFFGCSSPFCFLLIEFHYNFSISYKILGLNILITTWWPPNSTPMSTFVDKLFYFWKNNFHKNIQCLSCKKKCNIKIFM